MKKRAALLLTAIVCSLGLLQSAHAQGGGCPLSPPVFVTQNEVVQTIEFPAIPQNSSPTDRPVGVFFERQVSVEFAPGQRLVVSSTCIDDLLAIRNLTSGGEWRRDFRSPDGMSIEIRTSLVDVTDHLMMVPGTTNAIVVSYKDLVVDRYSASPVILGVVVGKDLPAETSQGVRVFGNIQPTDTLPPSATVVPTASPAPTPTATATTGAPVVAIQPQPPSEAPPQEPPAPAEEKAAANLGLPVSWPEWALGLVVLTLALVGIGGLAAVVKNRDRLPGEFKVYKDGLYQERSSPIVLAKYGRKMTIGSDKSADVVLPGDDVPPLAVRVELTGEDGRQAVIEYLDPLRPQTVVETRKLVHGQRYVIGRYELRYVNYAQERQKFDWRNGGGI